MRALLLAVLLLPATRSRAQEDQERVKIQPHLADLHLGDDLKTVHRRYPPYMQWSKTKDDRTRLTRYRVDRGQALDFPKYVQTLFLGFRSGRLVEIEAVYDEDFSRRKGHEGLAADYALWYGEPRRTDDRFWWADGRSVLRVFPAEIPATAEGVAVSSRAAVNDGSGPPAPYVVWRTAVQLFDKSAFDTEHIDRGAFGRSR